MNINGLTITTEGENRVVTYLGEVVAEFNIISDDYAYTNATEFAAYFADGIRSGRNVTDAKNYAYSKL